MWGRGKANGQNYPLKIQHTDQRCAVLHPQTAPPGQGITLKDIQSRFKGQDIDINPDGSISIHMKNGMGLVVRQVKKLWQG